MKPITVWKRLNNKVYEHNHISNGHQSEDIPKGTPEQNKSWSKGKWIKELGWLDGIKVVHKIAEKNTNHDSNKQIPQRERRIHRERFLIFYLVQNL